MKKVKFIPVKQFRIVLPSFRKQENKKKSCKQTRFVKRVNKEIIYFWGSVGYIQEN